jgi:lysophospholipase L1-like esterase
MFSFAWLCRRVFHLSLPRFKHHSAVMRPLIRLAIFLSICVSGFADPVRVACVGDSITFGMGIAAGYDYPAQLGRMLGSGYEVKNFGVNGATLLRNGDKPYDKQAAFKGAIDFKPDAVIIMLGANDTKPANWPAHGAEFDGDYRWLISQFQQNGAAPKIFLCRPSWIADPGKYGITDAGEQPEIQIIDKIAADLKLPEIDMHAAIAGHPEDLKDRVHPVAAGAALLAKAAYRALTGKDFQGDVPAP